MYFYIFIYKYAHIHTYAYVYIYMYTFIYIYIYIYIHIGTRYEQVAGLVTFYDSSNGIIIEPSSGTSNGDMEV
jgi:hypothetical protein